MPFRDRSNDSHTSDLFSVPVDKANIPAAKSFFAVFSPPTQFGAAVLRAHERKRAARDKR
jgi:hypothetical protein